MVSIAEAPGKIIISGEHFVVHGSNALAAAIDKTVKVYSETSDKNSILSRVDNQVFNIRIKPINPVSVVRNKILEYLNRKERIKITIESNIPRGSGLGSSSAISVATAASVASLFGEKLDKKTLYNIAFEGEKIIAETWVQKFEGVRSIREVQIYRASDGKKLASSVTNWCLLDMQTRKPLRIPKSFTAYYEEVNK